MLRRLLFAFGLASALFCPSAFAGDAEVALEKGKALAKANKLAEAIVELEKAAGIDPSNAEVQAELGNTKLLAGDLPGAIASLSTAVKLKPDLGVARYNLAYALRKSGQHQKAADQYRIFLSVAPEDADAHYGLAESLKATGDKLAAAEAYEAYANAEKRPAQARWVEKARATAATLRAEAPQPIVAAAKPSKEKSPSTASAPTPKRLSFSKTAPSEATEVAPTEAAASAPSLPPVATKSARPKAFHDALAELERGEYQSAEPKLAQLVRDHPDDALTTAALGSARLGLLDGPGAERAFLAAIPTAPSDAKAGLYLGLGEARRIQGQNAGAKEAYQKVLDDTAATAPIRRNAEERLALLK